MMSAQQSVPELVEAARATAKLSEDQIAAAASPEEVLAATLALEAVAIDTFAAFEARSQHHFRRGPFARKMKAKLLEAGEADLADRLYSYYLAVNVLKHGMGNSHRDLWLSKNNMFTVIQAPEGYVAQNGEPGLVDVTADGFFDGLAAAILEADAFLEGA
jgi:hypothetical protein